MLLSLLVFAIAGALRKVLSYQQDKLLGINDMPYYREDEILL